MGERSDTTESDAESVSYGGVASFLDAYQCKAKHSPKSLTQ